MGWSKWRKTAVSWSQQVEIAVTFQRNRKIHGKVLCQMRNNDNYFFNQTWLFIRKTGKNKLILAWSCIEGSRVFRNPISTRRKISLEWDQQGHADEVSSKRRKNQRIVAKDILYYQCNFGGYSLYRPKDRPFDEPRKSMDTISCFSYHQMYK